MNNDELTVVTPIFSAVTELYSDAGPDKYLSLIISTCGHANSRAGVRSRSIPEKKMRTEVVQAAVYAVGLFSNV